MKQLPFLLLVISLLASCSFQSSELGRFTHTAPGKLFPANSGQGRLGDKYVYAPEIRFPLESAPAYINSQVYGVGGSHGARGSTCDSRNYRYPWHDNYCEARDWGMPLCPAGRGHQGVDIRPATCQKNRHWVVAAENGVISSIGTYTVYLRGSNTGTLYRYMHMDKPSLRVYQGQVVRRGQRLGLVSNNMGAAKTSTHLHFDMKQTIRFPNGSSARVYTPPYSSLVNAYTRLLRGRP
jgi:murein DD-endopeptidase MepM/ murein hydrolase activator NlpD